MEWQRELTDYDDGVQDTSLDAFEGIIDDGTYENQVGMVLHALEELDRPCDHEIRAFIKDMYNLDLPNGTISARRNAIPGVHKSGYTRWNSGSRNVRVIRWKLV